MTTRLFCLFATLLFASSLCHAHGPDQPPHQLYKMGVLTEEEFQQKKALLLAKL